jgi:hypothetical protein
MVGLYLQPEANFSSHALGGGFAFPPLSGHLLFLNQCSEFLSSKGKSNVVVILEYGKENLSDKILT